MALREQLLLNNGTAMFDLTCLVRVGQMNDVQQYSDKLVEIVIPCWMRSTKTLDKLIELMDRNNYPSLQGRLERATMLGLSISCRSS